MLTVLKAWWRATRRPLTYRWCSIELEDGTILWGSVTKEFFKNNIRNFNPVKEQE